MTDLNTVINDLPAGIVAMLGIPFDANSSFMSGQALAPDRIRQGLYSESTNLCTENGRDLNNDLGWQDVGNLEISANTTAGNEIKETISKLLKQDVRIVSLGGDHSITYPVLQAYARKYPRLNILQLDAHPDLYDELNGNRQSHACPFARIMEEQLAVRLVQVGIRTMTPHQQEQADRFGVEVIAMKDWYSERKIDPGENVYLSIDLDVLDPAYASGVSHHEPGGMTSRQVLAIIQGLKANIVGADVVEYNPQRDVEGMTAMVAAKLVKEIIARMIE